MDDTESVIKTEGNFRHITKRDEIKWLTGFDYKFELPRDFHEHAQLKRWCNEECEDIVVFYEQEIQYRISEYIYFYSETDAMAFKLRWL